MTAPETALIGHTGFIGGNLARAHRFDALYNSENIEDIRGKAFGLVVCAGAPSLKWFANAHPEEDRATIARLTRCLDEVTAEVFILVSTVAVYARPEGVDEDTPLDGRALQPYGRHRFELEQRVRDRFSNALIIRLPGVFGPGLRKNVIFDLLKRNFSHASSADSTLQFYDVQRLWADIALAQRHGRRLLNVATEPLTLSEIGRVCTGADVDAECRGAAVHDDMQTMYAGDWEKRDRYLYSRDEVLADLTAFARQVAGADAAASVQR